MNTPHTHQIDQESYASNLGARHAAMGFTEQDNPYQHGTRYDEARHEAWLRGHSWFLTLKKIGKAIMDTPDELKQNEATFSDPVRMAEFIEEAAERSAKERLKEGPDVTEIMDAMQEATDEQLQLLRCGFVCQDTGLIGSILWRMVRDYLRNEAKIILSD